MKKRILLTAILLLLTMFLGCGKQGEASENTNTQTEDKALKKRVVIIGVDGAGAFFKDAQTPNIDRIFEKGATSYHVLTANPTISAQCWGSLLTGLTPQKHGFTNDNTATEKNEGAVPTIFGMTREVYPDAVLASFNNWNNINAGIIESNIGVYEDAAEDKELTEKIVTYLNENDPNLLFVQFDGVDHAGHECGYGKGYHLTVIGDVDKLIGRIYDTLSQKNDGYENLFIVTADHGGSGKNHGGLTDEEKYVFFGAVGDGVANGEIEDMYIRDIPAIVRHFLGLDNTKTGEGYDSYLPVGVFENTAGEKREKADTTRERTEAPGNFEEYMDTEHLQMYLPFDNSSEDKTGNNTVREVGKIYYLDGYFGSGAQLTGEGYIDCGNVEFKGSFSVSAWMNIASVKGDPVLYGNKDWSNGANPGFVYSLQEQPLFNVGKNGTKRMDVTYYLPDQFENTWIHTTLVVDFEKGKVRYYENFELMNESDLDDNFDTSAFNPTTPFCIGQDGTGKYTYSCDAVVDEFMIFNTALDGDKIAKMKAYYAQ